MWEEEIKGEVEREDEVREDRYLQGEEKWK